MTDVRIIRHIKIQGRRSPHRPSDHEYFEARREQLLLKRLNGFQKKVVRKTGGKCALCGCNISVEHFRHWQVNGDNAFHLTSKQAGVDSQVINQSQNTGLAAYVGGYSATKFSNSDRASSGLKQFTIKIPSSAVSESVNMGYGIQGKWFSYAHTTTMQWNEGTWICQIVGGSKGQELQESHKIVAYLDKHLLPERPGVLVVMQAGDGNHTEIHWAIGNVMYSASNYHQAMNAIKLAMSMRMYPSGQSKGVQY
jgi:hypothetical protein